MISFSSLPTSLPLSSHKYICHVYSSAILDVFASPQPPITLLMITPLILLAGIMRMEPWKIELCCLYNLMSRYTCIGVYLALLS
jgi:hypothetical protein